MRYEVSIAGMAIESDAKTPILLLSVEAVERTIPVVIGLMEAAAIASELKGVSFERPMTHDLFHNFIQRAGMAVSRVVINDLHDGTYFARIFFSAGDREIDMDARPSDAIALALRFNAPLYVESSVIDILSREEAPSHEAMDRSEEGKKWEEYLENLDPDDFSEV